MTQAEHVRRYPEVWRRFNPRQTLVQYAWYLGIVFVAVWSVSNLDIPWFYFLDAHVQAADLVARMVPPVGNKNRIDLIATPYPTCLLLVKLILPPLTSARGKA